MEIQIKNQRFEVIDNTPLETEIMVTIWCITYNHQNYIEDALRGFIEQRTTFNYEVVVLDDCSNDGTTDILRKYASQYPNIFKIYIAKENFYTNPQKFKIHTELKQKAFRGKYIAICEGDDCWIDRNKLQIQINYMEKNKDCSLTIHDGVRVDYDEGYKIRVFEAVKEESDLSLEEILFHKCRMDTASIVFRSEDLIMDDFFCNLGIGDWPRLLFSASKGRVHFFDRTMSLYRFRVPGSWTKKRANSMDFELIHRLRLLDFMKNYNSYTNGKYPLLMIRYERQCVNVILYVMKKISCKDQDKILKTVLKEYPYLRGTVSEYVRNGYFIGQARGYSDFLVPSIKDITRGNKIVIWGIGKGGDILTDYFNLVKEDIFCYCIADETTTSEYRGKVVKKLSDFSMTDDIVVIVAIYSVPFSTLAEILEDNSIAKAYFPFVYEGIRHKEDYDRELNKSEGIVQ